MFVQYSTASKGVVKERKPKDIIQKAANMRDGYNKVCEWINSTGQGLDSDEACFKARGVFLYTRSS